MWAALSTRSLSSSAASAGAPPAGAAPWRRLLCDGALLGGWEDRDLRRTALLELGGRELDVAHGAPQRALGGSRRRRRRRRPVAAASASVRLATGPGMGAAARASSRRGLVDGAVDRGRVEPEREHVRA